MPKGVFPRKRQDPIARFWKNVKIKGPNDCWRWKSSKGGYGTFFDGSRQIGAHRFILQVTIRRDLKDEEFACHTCDKKWCVNPKHLFVGTAADNSADMVRKGRKERGGDVHGSKLNEQDVREIRKSYIKDSTPASELARKYGVTQFNILAIVRRQSWAWVDDGLVENRTLKEKCLRGKDVPISVLTEADVLEIRRLHPAVTQRQLAEKFGCSRYCIFCVVHRKTWKHL